MSKQNIGKASISEQELQNDLHSVEQPKSASEKQLLTAQELLDQELDNVISYDQLLILTKTGQIPFVTLGNRRFYRRQTIRDWFADMEENSVAVQDHPSSSADIKKILRGGKVA